MRKKPMDSIILFQQIAETPDFPWGQITPESDILSFRTVC